MVILLAHHRAFGVIIIADSPPPPPAPRRRPSAADPLVVVDRQAGVDSAGGQDYAFADSRPGPEPGRREQQGGGAA